MWTELGMANTELERTLRELSKLHGRDVRVYEDAVAKCAAVRSSEVNTVNIYCYGLIR